MKDYKSAFPRVATFHQDGVEIVEETIGLSRRELFAAMAMQGICARPISSGKPQTQQFVSTWAVEYADALIAELDGEES